MSNLVDALSRSRMMKRPSSLESSRKILLPSRISLDFETVGISRILSHGCQMTHGMVPHGMTMWMPHGMLRGVHMA